MDCAAQLKLYNNKKSIGHDDGQTAIKTFTSASIDFKIDSNQATWKPKRKKLIIGSNNSIMDMAAAALCHGDNFPFFFCFKSP